MTEADGLEETGQRQAGLLERIEEQLCLVRGLDARVQKCKEEIEVFRESLKEQAGPEQEADDAANRQEELFKIQAKEAVA